MKTTSMPPAAIVPGDRRPRAGPVRLRRQQRQRQRRRRRRYRQRATAAASLSGTLNGGGSSAQEAAQGVWRAGFQGDNSGVTVNYDPVGSGTGRENFISKAFSFAGSDSALSTDEGELDAAKERCGGDDPSRSRPTSARSR